MALDSGSSDLDSFLVKHGNTSNNDTSDLDSFLSRQQSPASSQKPQTTLADRAKDVAITGLKSAIGVPEAALGLVDIVTAGKAGKLAEQVGFRPKEAKAFLDEQYSPAQQAANRAVNEAQGFTPSLKAYAQYPSALAHQLGEQTFPILAGGVIGRGAALAMPNIAKAAPYIPGAIGEGVLTAGQNVEQVREETPGGELDFTKQVLPVAASGVLTGAIAVGSGKLANELGFTDFNRLIAGQGSSANPVGLKAIARNIAGTTAFEAGEEGLQSPQEQVAQNYAQGRPLSEGVGKATAQGIAMGGVMGAGGAVGDTVINAGPLSRAANTAQQTGAANAQATDVSDLPADGAANQGATGPSGPAMGGSGAGVGTANPDVAEERAGNVINPEGENDGFIRSEKRENLDRKLSEGGANDARKSGMEDTLETGLLQGNTGKTANGFVDSKTGISTESGDLADQLTDPEAKRQTAKQRIEAALVDPALTDKARQTLQNDLKLLGAASDKALDKTIEKIGERAAKNGVVLPEILPEGVENEQRRAIDTTALNQPGQEQVNRPLPESAIQQGGIDAQTQTNTGTDESLREERIQAGTGNILRDQQDLAGLQTTRPPLADDLTQKSDAELEVLRQNTFNVRNSEALQRRADLVAEQKRRKTLPPQESTDERKDANEETRQAPEQKGPLLNAADYDHLSSDGTPMRKEDDGSFTDINGDNYEDDGYIRQAKPADIRPVIEAINQQRQVNDQEATRSDRATTPAGERKIADAVDGGRVGDTDAGIVRVPGGLPEGDQSTVDRGVSGARGDISELKQPWKFTKDEISKKLDESSTKEQITNPRLRADQGNIELGVKSLYIRSHKDSVRSALDEGLEVPSKVLNEYPDLIARASWNSLSDDDAKKVTQSIDSGIGNTFGVDGYKRKWEKLSAVDKNKLTELYLNENSKRNATSLVDKAAGNQQVQAQKEGETPNAEEIGKIQEFNDGQTVRINESTQNTANPTPAQPTAQDQNTPAPGTLTPTTGTQAEPMAAAVPTVAKSGKPFSSAEVAQKALKSSAYPETAATHEVVPVDGGFGLAPKTIAQTNQQTKKKIKDTEHLWTKTLDELDLNRDRPDWMVGKLNTKSAFEAFKLAQKSKREAHADAVENALVHGESVPAKVLNDYPGIKRKYAKTISQQASPSKTPSASETSGTQPSPILTQPKKPYLLDQKRAYLKANPKAIQSAKDKAFADMESNYEDDLLKAEMQLPFESYRRRNPKMSDGLARQTYDNLRQSFDLPVQKTVVDQLESSKDIEGDKLNKSWVKFSDDSGSLNIPRNEMPQVKAEHRGALVNFLNAKGIEHEKETLSASELKPTQLEFSPEKVKKAQNYEGGDRSILISSDNHVVDGHHQWLAKLNNKEEINVIRLKAPIKSLLNDVNEFPSVKQSAGVSQPLAPAPAKTPEVEANQKDAVAKQSAKPKRLIVNDSDDLLAAIAKLGGLKRDEAKAQGIDPKAFATRGSGIKRVFTKAGRSYDEMAELLRDYHFNVPLANDLVAKVSGSINQGEKHYNPVGYERMMAIKQQERFDDEQAQTYADLEDKLDAGEIGIEDLQDALDDFDDIIISETFTGQDAIQSLNDYFGIDDEQATIEASSGTTDSEALQDYTEQDIADRERTDQRRVKQEETDRIKAEQKARADRERDSLVDDFMGTAPKTNDVFGMTDPLENINKPSAKLSQSQPTTGSTVAELTAKLNAADKKLLQDGQLNIVQKVSDVPDSAISVDANGIEGFYLKGKVYVVANNVTPETLRSVLAHEYLHASLAENKPLRDRILGAQSELRDIFAQVEAGKYTGRYKTIYDAAMKRVNRANTPAADRYEEFLAYAISEHSKSPQSLPERLAKAVQNLIAAIRAAIFRYTGRIDKISPADLAALAKSSLNYSNNSSSSNASVMASQKTMLDKITIDGKERWTINSDGKPIAQDEEGVRNFYRWFGDSKAVDMQGKPLVVYHGSPDARFMGEDATFKTQKQRYGFGRDKAAHWFSSDRRTANSYADDNRAFDYQNAEPAIIDAYLKLDNPLIVDAEGQEWRTAQQRGKTSDVIEEAFNSDHDGVIIKNVKDDYNNGVRTPKTTTFTVFESNQIKSTTLNTGTFDPQNPDIRYSLADDVREFKQRAGLGPKKTLVQTVQDILDRGIDANAQALKDRWAEIKPQLEQGVFDKFLGIKLAEKEILGDVAHSLSGYIGARLSTGSSSTMSAVLQYGAPEWKDGIIQRKANSKGLAEILQPIKDDMENFAAWMVARRADRLFQEGKENNFTRDMIDAGLSLAKPEYQGVADGIAELNKSILDLAEQAGLVDPQSRSLWESSDYIPFYRLIEEQKTTGPRNKKGLSHQSSGIRLLKGGENPLSDPLGNMMQNWAHLIDASMKNSALDKTLTNLTGSRFVTSIPRAEFKQALIPKEQIKKLMLESGLPTQIVDAMPKEITQGIAKMWAMQAPTDPDVVRVMRSGKSEYFRVDDPMLLTSLAAVNQSPLPGIFKPMRYMKSLLTSAVTADPTFMARNFIRDSMHSWTIAEEKGFKLGMDSIQGAVKSFKEEGGFIDMMFAGASFQGGYGNYNNPDAARKSMDAALRKKGISNPQGFIDSIVDTPKKYWEMYRSIGDAIENANREATLENAKRAGAEKAQYLFEAKDLMDFSMQGSFTLVRAMSDMLPFFNARLIGLYRLMQAGKTDEARRMILMKGASIAMFSLALLALNSDNDDYEELEDFDKDQYWHIFAGDQHFRIPKPFELGLIFGTIPERSARALIGKDSLKEFAARMGHGASDTLAFNPVPQMFRPFIELYANKDMFTGRPIENMSDEGKLASARYNEYTSETMRTLSSVLPEALGASPKRLEHLMHGYTGAMGMYILGASDSLVRVMSGMPESPSLRMDRLPVLKAFYQEKPAMHTVYGTQFYDMLRKTEQIQRTINAYKKEGQFEKARELQVENADKLSVRKSLNKTNDKLSDVRKQIDAIYRSELSPEQKRLRIDSLMTKQNNTVQAIVKRTHQYFD
jgi:hypothetical protein